MNIRKHAGLDLETDTIIEAACLVSDGSLDTIIEVCHIQVQMSVSAKQEPSAYRIARKNAQLPVLEGLCGPSESEFVDQSISVPL